MQEESPTTTVTVVEVEKKTPALPLPTAAEPAGSTDDTPPPSSSSSCCLKSFLRHAFSPPAHGEDYSIPQALVSIDMVPMVVLLTAITCGAGGTLIAIDSMGQIGESLGYPPPPSAPSCPSDDLHARYRFPRPLALTVVLLASCAGHLLIALGAPRGTLYVTSVALRRHLRAVRAQAIPQLYNLGAVASPVRAQRARRGQGLRRRGRAAARREAGRRGGQDVPRRRVLQEVVPHRGRRHGGRRARVAGARVESHGVLQGRHLCEV
jgi:hypothetical protein